MVFVSPARADSLGKVEGRVAATATGKEAKRARWVIAEYRSDQLSVPIGDSRPDASGDFGIHASTDDDLNIPMVFGINSGHDPDHSFCRLVIGRGDTRLATGDSNRG